MFGLVAHADYPHAHENFYRSDMPTIHNCRAHMHAVNISKNNNFYFMCYGFLFDSINMIVVMFDNSKHYLKNMQFLMFVKIYGVYMFEIACLKHATIMPNIRLKNIYSFMFLFGIILNNQIWGSHWGNRHFAPRDRHQQIKYQF